MLFTQWLNHLTAFFRMSPHYLMTGNSSQKHKPFWSQDSTKTWGSLRLKYPFFTCLSRPKWSQVWWYTPVILSFSRLRQEDLEFKASVLDIARQWLKLRNDFPEETPWTASLWTRFQALTEPPPKSQFSTDRDASVPWHLFYQTRYFMITGK